MYPAKNMGHAKVQGGFLRLLALQEEHSLLPGAGAEGAEHTAVDVQCLTSHEIGGRGSQVNSGIAQVLRFTPSCPGGFPLNPFVE